MHVLARILSSPGPSSSLTQPLVREHGSRAGIRHGGGDNPGDEISDDARVGVFRMCRHGIFGRIAGLFENFAYICQN